MPDPTSKPRPITNAPDFGEDEDTVVIQRKQADASQKPGPSAPKVKSGKKR